LVWYQNQELNLSREMQQLCTPVSFRLITAGVGYKQNPWLRHACYIVRQGFTLQTRQSGNQTVN
jgi:hypothetical protein